jgi:hypothetical protein
VVDDPVDHRTGDTSSPNTSPQRPKVFVGGDDQAGALIAGEPSWKNMLAASGSSSQLFATHSNGLACFALFATGSILRPVDAGCNRGAP